ncbi:DUF4183 domain-containing protein [Paenibacillus sp. OSY-SE]|uniref:DUF4183 domain-containing protein n=1 Tax=Paenibacillus sp. OSY-SE TaxID=1196323 RepID=UPI00035C3627|nr:DUF4183 domain-containing protein [Paenibacillus sp. OSY-SE]
MSIIKPHITGKRYYSTIGAGTGTGATFTIAVTEFTDDDGGVPPAFPSSYSYYNLYINGMLQLSSTSTVTVNSLAIPGGDVLDPAIPIIIEFF